MPWTKNDYPRSLKYLNAPVRDKAIEIGNELLDAYSDSRAIAIATARAEKWAKNRNMKIRQDSGSKGRAGKKGKGQGIDKGQNVHVQIRDDGRWAVQAEATKRPIATYDAKQPALERGRQLASRNNADLIVHRKDGKVSRRESMRQKHEEATYHVLPRDGTWIVRREGSKQAIRVFDRKNEARRRGREMARRRYGQLFIHDRKGHVQAERSFEGTPPR